MKVGGQEIGLRESHIINVFFSILRSTWFLSYNAFGFVAAHCTVR